MQRSIPLIFLLLMMINPTAAMTTMEEINHYQINSQGLDVQDNIVAVAAASQGVMFFKIEPSGALTSLGNYSEGTMNAIDVCINGNYAYIANGLNGFWAIDITDFTKIQAVATIKDMNAQKLHCTDQYVLVLQGFSGMALLDISKPESPTVIERTNLGGDLKRGSIDHPYLYTLDVKQSEIDIFKFNSSGIPEFLESHPVEMGLSLATSSNKVYVGKSNGNIQVFDMKDDKLLSSKNITDDGQSSNIMILGEYIIHSTTNKGMKIININNGEIIAQTNVTGTTSLTNQFFIVTQLNLGLGVFKIPNEITLQTNTMAQTTQTSNQTETSTSNNTLNYPYLLLPIAIMTLIRKKNENA